MTLARVRLKPGHTYYAGVDIPFYVPNSLVVDKVVEYGGKNVRIVDREDVKLSFNPKIDPKYSDDWEEVVIAYYDGPEKVIAEERRWKWIVSTGGGATQPVTAIPVPGEQAPNRLAPILGGLAVGGFLLYKVIKRK